MKNIFCCANNRPKGYLVKDSKNGEMFIPDDQFKFWKSTINARKKEFIVKKAVLVGISLEIE